MKKWILSLVALSSVQAFAADSTEATFKVKQVIKSHKLVVVQTNATEQFPNGKIFLANFDDGTQCSLVLKNSGKQLLTLDSTPCDQLDRLTLKTKIEPSLISVDEQPRGFAPQGIAGLDAKKSSEEKKVEQNNPDNFYDKSTVGRLGVSVYYNSADHLKFDDGKVESSGAKFDADFKLESAVGVGLHYMRAKPYAWGYSVGGLLETTRNIQSVSFSGGLSGTGSVDSDNFKLTLLIAEGSALYRFENFYIPFGLSVGIPVLEYKSDISKIEATAGVGLQAGLGYFVNDNLSVEAYYRVIGIKLVSTELATDNKTDFGYGYLRGATIGIKYLF